MGKVGLGELVVKVVDGAYFAVGIEGRDDPGERAVEMRTRHCQRVEKRPRRRHHDEAVPQAAAQLQHLCKKFVGLLPKSAHGENLDWAVDRTGGPVPTGPAFPGLTL